MNSFVLLTGKFLVTIWTSEGLLSRVKSVVSGKSLLLLESHGADITLEGIVFQVAVNVILQFDLVPEGLSTVLAGIGPLRLVYLSDVFVQ